MTTQAQRQERRSRRTERKLAEQRAKRRRQYAIFGSLVAVAIIVVAVLIILNRPGSGTAFPAMVAAAAPSSSIPTSGRTMGNPKAPVKVVEWGDYQCTACGSFFQTGEAQFISQYVATGKVLFQFNDLAFIGPDSTRAAEAAGCALDQGKFWQYHNSLYSNQHQENASEFTTSRLKQLAQALGLDMGKFNSCYDSGKYKQEVQNGQTQATNLNITQTPTFFVNGQNINYGGQYSTLQDAIDKALQK